MKTILLPVDFSQVTPYLVATAKGFASANNCKIELLHVAPSNEGWVTRTVLPISVVVNESTSQLHDALREVKASLADPSARVNSVLIEGGSIADHILQQSEETNSDIIIMGGRSHGTLFHLLTGSISSAVTARAKCPVLLVPHVSRRQLAAAA